MTVIISDQDNGQGLNVESLKFLAENPYALKMLTSNPVHRDVLRDQPTFDFWRRMCDNRQYAVNHRIPVKHFTPAMLKWYMQRQVNRQKKGRNERNVSRHGQYHVAGKSLVCPCPELIELCANNEIIIRPCFCDAKSLKALRRELRETTMEDYADIWQKFGVPLKKTSSILCGNVNNAEGKMFVTHVEDDVERITLMLYFAKMFNMSAVKPGIKNALSRVDEQKVSGLTEDDEKLAKPVPVPKVKLSKADLKFMNRRRKKKKTRKVKPPARSNRNRKQREMNRKFELLRLKRAMGLEKTVV